MAYERGQKVSYKITVREVASTVGRDDTPQWKLTCEVPYSQYPGIFWVDKAAFPDIGAETAGPFDARLTVGALQDGKNPEQIYNYRLYLDDIQPAGTLVQQAPPERQQTRQVSRTEAQDSGMSIDERIAWNSAVNNAVHLHGPVISGTDVKWENIYAWAHAIYGMIRQGPVEPQTEPSVEAHKGMGMSAFMQMAREQLRSRRWRASAINTVLQTGIEPGMTMDEAIDRIEYALANASKTFDLDVIAEDISQRSQPDNVEQLESEMRG